MTVFELTAGDEGDELFVILKHVGKRPVIIVMACHQRQCRGGEACEVRKPSSGTTYIKQNSVHGHQRRCSQRTLGKGLSFHPLREAVPMRTP